MSWFTRRRVGILVIVAFVVGAIEFLPAYQFEDSVNRALPPPWHISMTGTVWNGFGVLQAGQGSDVLTVPLTWTFEPAALARLHLVWKLVPDSPAIAGSIKAGAGWQALEFSEAALSIDAREFQRAIPVLALFSPWGTIRVNTPADARVTVAHGNEFRVNGDALVYAEHVGLGRYSPQTLGSYQLKFTARDTSIGYAITQSSGALVLDGGGSIQVSPVRQFAFAGNMTPSPDLPDTLLAQLKSISTPAPGGRLRVDWKGRW